MRIINNEDEILNHDRLCKFLKLGALCFLATKNKFNIFRRNLLLFINDILNTGVRREYISKRMIKRFYFYNMFSCPPVKGIDK